MTDKMLPAEFSDLEPFAATWCLPTEHERFAQRVATPMDEMQAFYDAITPRYEEAMAYCDTFALDDMPEDAVNLLRLIYSFILASFPVELWAQNYPPDTRGTEFVRLSEPLP